MMKKSMLFYMLLLICGANASFAQSQSWLDSILNRVGTIQEESMVSCRNVTVALSCTAPNNFYRYYWFAEGAVSNTNYIDTGISCQINIQFDTTVYCIGFPVGSGTIYRATRYDIRVPSNDTIRDTVKTCNSYTWHGRMYDTTGVFYDTVGRDCDSTFYVLNLTIVKGDTRRPLKCVPYHMNGEWYGHVDVISDSDTHSYQRIVTDADLTFGQCVVTDRLVLTISGSHDTLPDLDTNACDSLTYGSTTYYVSQITEPEQVGVNNSTNQCNIYQRLNLTIHHSSSGTETVTACDEYRWQGTTYGANTIATATMQSIDGCDSVVTLRLTIRRSSSDTESVTVCDSYTWHGQSYESTCTVVDTVSNQYGCDSIVTLNLTVNHSNTGTETQTKCDEYTWHGITYTASTNSPTYTYTNAAGCDSVVTLNLTVNHSADSTIFATASGNYLNSWLGVFYANPTSDPVTWDITIKNGQTTFGCDSNYTLHLILNPITRSDISVTACNNYTWLDSTYNSTGMYSDTVRNQYGCDSVVTLHLIINPITGSDTYVKDCDEYSWQGSTYDSTGMYSVVFRNQYGCDSVVTLHLTIIHHEGNMIEKTVCNSFPYGDSVYSESTIIYQTTTMESCDRVDTIRLNVLGIKTPPIQKLVKKEHPLTLIYPIPYSDTNEDYHFQWYRGKDPIKNATKQYYKLTDKDRNQLVYDSIYTVKIWNKFDLCSSESSATISIMPSQDTPQIETLPNPNNGRFTSTLLADGEEAAEAILFNSFGHKIATLPLEGNTASSAGNLTTGVYLLNIITRSGRTYTDKIIVK